MTERNLLVRIASSVGPAIIVASVVLGPGSLLTSSKVGMTFGYDMLWLLAGTVLLMIGMTLLSAYVGVLGSHTPCEEVAKRLGRGPAVVVGVVLFVIIACFQTSNNVAVIAAVEGLLPQTDAPSALSILSFHATTLLLLNGLIAVALFGLKSLYQLLERFMMVLVMLMLLGFAVNLVFAAPSISGIFGGLVPKLALPEGAELLPELRQTPDGPVYFDSMGALIGMIATTLSVAGAFYQAYLVREKGWNADDLKKGKIDSIAGIAVLGLVSAMVMVTSAAALSGQDAGKFQSIVDVARQLEPMFGTNATLLFSLGVFAAAFSSFLGNALIGGTVLSDSLGLGSSIDSRWPKLLTVLALVCGMAAALYCSANNVGIVNIIIFAQALTVVGVPLLAFVIVWLAIELSKTASKPVPKWLIGVGGVVTVFVTLLAIRTAWSVVLKLSL